MICKAIFLKTAIKLISNENCHAFKKGDVVATVSWREKGKSMQNEIQRMMTWAYREGLRFSNWDSPESYMRNKGLI